MTEQYIPLIHNTRLIAHPTVQPHTMRPIMEFTGMCTFFGNDIVSLDPKNKKLYIYSPEGKVKKQHAIPNDFDPTCIAVSLSTNEIGIANSDNRVYIMNVLHGKSTRKFAQKKGGRIAKMTFSPSGRYIATIIKSYPAEKLAILDLADKKTKMTMEVRTICDVVFSRYNTVTTLTENKNQFKLNSIDVKTKQRIRESIITDINAPNMCKILPDRKHIAVLEFGLTYVINLETQNRVFEHECGEEIMLIDTCIIECSADGRRLAILCDDSVMIVDTGRWVKLFNIHIFSSLAISMSFSLDSTRLMIGFSGERGFSAKILDITEHFDLLELEEKGAVSLFPEYRRKLQVDRKERDTIFSDTFREQKFPDSVSSLMKEYI